MSKENVIICFCKQPEPGLVKSRLAKDLGTQQAAEVYSILLAETLHNLSATDFKTYLYCYPNTQHKTLEKYKNQYELELKKQSNGDLGMKMLQAFKDQLNDNNIVLIGTDCLEINAEYIQKAFDELDSGNEIVLGPTEDGGYALIGASKTHASIFQDIDWSTEEVLEQTINKIRKLGWEYSCLPTVRDLDILDDYQYFSSHEKYRHLFN